MFRTGIALALGLVMGVGFAQPTAAAPVMGLEYVLSTADGGVSATGSWSGTGNNGFQVAYTIDYDWSAALYTYQYTFSGVGGAQLSRDLSHHIIEVSTDFTASDLLAGTTSYAEIKSEGDIWSATAPPGGTDTAGIKWENGGLVVSVTIVTTRQPMEGTFFAKGGQNTAVPVDTFWVPDTIEAPPIEEAPPVVPLPAAAWGGLALLGGLAARRLSRRRAD